MARSTKLPTTKPVEVDPIVLHVKDAIIASVRMAGETGAIDLSQRQLGVFFIIATEDRGDHTVRGLAERLNLSKPAVTRALDRLEEFELVKRREDPRDRRSVVVARTPTGSGYLRDWNKIVKGGNKPSRKKARHEAVEQEEDVEEVA